MKGRPVADSTQNRNDEEPAGPSARIEDGLAGDAAELERCEELETREADVEAPLASITRLGRTFESFRYRDFSLFWSGALVSNVGTWMQNTAIGLLVAYGLNQGAFALGMVNFLSGIPVIFLALPGGALADRVDRRRLIIVFQWVLLVQATVLGYLAMSGAFTAVVGPDAQRHAFEALAWLGGLGMIAGVCSALTFPAWQALLPSMVPRKTLLNAIALNSAQFQSSRLLGPLVAGAIVVLLNPLSLPALFGSTMSWIFYINAVSFLFVIGALWAIKPGRFANGGQMAPGPSPRSGGAAAGQAPAARPARTREGSFKMLMGGLKYASVHRDVAVLLTSTALMTIFGMPYMMLLPVIVKDVLHLGEVQVTILMSVNGLGAVVGALGVAGFSAAVRRERLIPWFLLTFAAVITAFGLSHWYYLSVGISAMAGAALMATNSLTNTSIQASVPDYLRGRVMALFVMCFMGIMPVSSILFGTLGQWIGPSTAVALGGVVLACWAAVLLLRPGLLAPTDVPAEPVTAGDRL
jgi:MFS family permease